MRRIKQLSVYRSLPRPVAGCHLPPPRPTRRAYGWALRHIALPVLIVLLLADLALYWLFAVILGRCYGVLCLFG